jgi:hypothetical protein
MVRAPGLRTPPARDNTVKVSARDRENARRRAEADAAAALERFLSRALPYRAVSAMYSSLPGRCRRQVREYVSSTCVQPAFFAVSSHRIVPWVVSVRSVVLSSASGVLR